MAYQRRYRVPPVRNKSVNTFLCSVVDQLGAREAPHVAAFYLTHNDPFYMRTRHPPSLLARDAGGLRTQWATGMKATTGEAKEAERHDNSRAIIDAANKILQEGL